MDGTLYDLSQIETWRGGRYDLINAHYPEGYFRNKNVLEVAAAWGHIGRYFRDTLGAKVTSTDHYDKWVEIIKERGLPDIEAYVQNLLDPWPFKNKFDVIICMGVIYHVPFDRAEEVIDKVCQNCDEVILETSVLEDNLDPYYVQYWEKPTDLWETIGTDYCIPTKAFVERVITKNSMTFTAVPSTAGRYLWFCKKEST